MVNCPECEGEMKRDHKIRLMVCLRCGLALSRTEIDKIRQKQNDAMHDRRIDKDEERRRDYLKWYLKDNDE